MIKDIKIISMTDIKKEYFPKWIILTENHSLKDQTTLP